MTPPITVTSLVFSPLVSPLFRVSRTLSETLVMIIVERSARLSKTSANGLLAMTLAEAGHAVLPVSAKTKQPYLAHSFHDASTNCATVEAWWRNNPTALAAIATRDVLVIDVDAKPALADSITALLAAIGMTRAALAASCSLIVATPGGGRHFYYKRTPGLAVRNDANDIASSVDTRGHAADGTPKGYIIAPNNVLPDGRSYRIVSGLFDQLLTGQLAEAPPALAFAAAFSKRERATIAADGILEKLLALPPSQWRTRFEAYQDRKRARTEIAAPSVSSERMRRYAEAALHKEAGRLAVLTDGRRHGVFLAACCVARFAAHNVLAPSEIEARLLAGWDASGAGAKHGRDFALKTIRRGLEKGRNDALPILATDADRGASS
jgi:Bifunctional DNA primase/polymerase, N-terminal